MEPRLYRQPASHSVLVTILYVRVIMAALCNRGAIIFLPCDFCLSSSIFFFLA